MNNNIRCPYCGKQNTWSVENKFRPFCSARCQLIDLGAWADEKYHISGEKMNSETTKKQDEEDKE